MHLCMQPCKIPHQLWVRVTYNVLTQFFMDHSTASVYFGIQLYVGVVLHLILLKRFVSVTMTLNTQLVPLPASLFFVYLPLDGTKHQF